MNTKETLKKLAEALGVVAEKEETVQVIENEETVQVTEEIKEDTEGGSVEEAEGAAEVAPEAPVEEAVLEEKAPEEIKEDPKMEAMSKEIEALKEMLRTAIEADSKKADIPEVPKEEPKGLTHSPERQVKTKANGMGNKGENIQSRVWKYINNN